MPCICIPVPPMELKRNDVIRIKDGRGTDPSDVDVRVTGVKGNAHSGYARVNYVDAQGKRRSVDYNYWHQSGRFAFKLIPIPTLIAIKPCSYAAALSGGFLIDETGDIAFREGEWGVWLRLDGRWPTSVTADLPRVWKWEQEKHHTWMLMERVNDAPEGATA